MSVATAAIEVFFSYSHKDESLRDELAKHLSILHRQGIISGWHDRRIMPGQEWAGQIDAHLNSADVILLLISADFLFSNYCYDIEMKQAMKRHDAGETCVIPIILRPVVWKGTPFGKLQALPKDAKPVTTWLNLDEAFENVTQGFLTAVEELRSGQAQRHVALRHADTAQVTDLSSRTGRNVEADVGGDSEGGISTSAGARGIRDSVPKAIAPARRIQADRRVRKVFLSSTYEDLKGHRARVIKAIRNAGFFVDPMEEWTADSDEPKHFSQARVEDCDLCLLLVAFRRGFIPDGETKSITQMEYAYARANGIDVLVFMLGEQHVWPPEFDDRTRDGAMHEWRAELRKQHGVEEFGTDPSTVQIEAALVRWMAKERVISPVRKGIEVFAELIRTDPKLRDEMVRFENDFNILRQQIEELADLKDVHDLLHELKIHSYNVIVREARHFPDDDALQILGEYEVRLSGIVDKLDMVTSTAAVQGHVSWMPKLHEARSELREAIDGPEAAKLSRAIKLMKSVLATQPSKIDTRLNAKAEELRLTNLVNAMATISVKIATGKLDPEKVTEFQTGAKALNTLKQSLESLVDAHNQWQDADNELGLVEESLENDDDELLNSWPFLSQTIRLLYARSSAAKAQALAQDEQKLTSAIQARDPAKMRRYFRRYRAQAAERFYEVDKNLRDLCGELRAVGAPLASVLNVLRENQ